jgi:class 3 adenylate cyclase
MQDVNESSPVELHEMDLLITIAKTVRVARFIRSSTAVKISSKVNWYWFFNAVNPVWWWNSCRSRITRKRNKREQVRMSELASENMGGGGGGGGVGDLLERKLVRRKSWGGIGLSALSAAKAAKEAQDEEKKKDGLIKSTCKMALRYVGLLPPGNDQWKRHLAATKIQRAWRRVLEQRKVEESLSQHLDFAWKQSSRSAMNPERSAMARSMTRQRAVRKSNKFRASSNHPHHLDPSRRGNVSVGKRRSESQVGSAMRELTGQRVAIGIIVALVLTVLFTYTEDDATRPATMIVLYNQTGNAAFANMSLEAARQSSIPDLFQYKLADNSTRYYTPLTGEPSTNLREKEILRIQISGQNGTTVGLFANKDEVQQQALISLLSTVFIILVWIFGVTAFAGPVMILVVIPIERMVRLLGMLMLDPLGYQSTSRYKKFVSEEDEFTKNTRWTKDVLKGMETSFLMLTIRRIGSLMKVGFGSAGVEIIRNNLEKGHSKNMLILTEKGSNVSCIFLFCDIRQFTDATECLQEEVFVFTNRVAAVVHSICHSYGGSANKNIGDAFLLSWQLEEDDEMCLVQNGFRSSAAEGDNFVAKNNQADKALLSVVKICMALHHNDYYLEKLSEHARKALLNKLAGRSGPVVQLGFGLHAGSAVQGAIGSQRKIDATYVSESVERAEDLEGWTKTYGVKMLMSDSFCRLLHPSNRRRCRKIDQLVIRNEDGEDDEAEDDPPLLELWTFDMDIDALWRNKPGSGKGKSDAGHESDTESTEKGSRREIMRMPTSGRNLSAGGGILKGSGRRRSLRSGSGKDILGGDEHSDAGMIPLGPNHQGGGTTSQGVGGANNDEGDNGGSGAPQLTLPTGPALYNANVWVSEEMRRIRELYSDGIFFQKFNSGFQSYYSRDWEHARQCFVTILERFEDGPSRYFLTQIEKNNGKPPRDFRGYGTA